jgi:microcystin-dependent protein
MSDPFLGEIKAVGFNFAPVGYAFANGAIIPVQQNSALFALLGTFYGGNGVSTFGLPNLQSRQPIGFTTNPNTLSGLTNLPIGNVGGVETTILTGAQLPTHNHGANSTANAQTNVSVNTSGLTASTTINALTAPSSTATVPTGNFLTVGVTGGATPVAIKPYGPSGTATTLAAGAATTTIGGTATASASTAVGVTTQIANAGNSAPVALRNPYLTVNYIIATQGLFPSRN